MTSSLVKIFIKNYEKTDDPEVRLKYGTLCGIVGIITNSFLCLSKLAIGLIAASISIIADAINNLSDVGSSIITLFGFKIASKPADKDHPFGHQRIEYITGLIISFIIIFIGISLFRSSLEKVFNPEEVVVKWYTFVTLGLSICLKLWQGLFYRSNGRNIDSTSLIASSQDSLSDCLSTSAVLISIVIFVIFSLNIDAYMGILVSSLIIINGIKLVRNTISPLIGEAPDQDYVMNIENKIKEYDGVLGIHDLVVHCYGPAKKFASVHVEVDANKPILVSHDIVDNIERDFRKQGLDLVIHMDPIDSTNAEAIKYKEEVVKILEKIDPALKFHDFRIVSGNTHINLIFDLVIPFDYQEDVIKLKQMIQTELDKYDQKLYCVITFDYNYIGM